MGPASSHPPPTQVLGCSSSDTLSPRYLENLPSKRFTKRNRLTFPGFLNSQHWVFVKEGLDDFRKDCPPTPGPKGCLSTSYSSWSSQYYLQEEAKQTAQKAEKAFLEDVKANVTPHPLALYPQLKEALPAEVICLGLREGLLGVPKTILCRCPGYKKKGVAYPQ